MTPADARFVIFQTAKQLARQGQSAEDFQFLIDYSPQQLGEDFNRALDIEFNIIDHVIALVWTPTQHCG